MVSIKTPKEIEILDKSGTILATILKEASKKISDGVCAYDIDQFVIELAKKNNAICAFKGYTYSKRIKPYPSAICISINDEVVHGISSKDKIIKNGDIVSLDLGINYKGLFTDAAITVIVGKVDKEVKRLVKITEKSLMAGIKQVKEGNYISDISKAVQECVETNRFSVIREFVGHGVGYGVHEEPSIPNFYNPSSADLKLQEGMVLAIEPMVSMGDWRINFDDDGWGNKTKDGSLVAHFEHTVVVTKTGYKILTKI